MTDITRIPPRDHVAQVLETAADKLESGEITWVQHTFGHVDGDVVRACAVGTLCWVAGEQVNKEHLVVNAAAEAMKPYLYKVLTLPTWERKGKAFLAEPGTGENALIAFNDAIAKDVSEVVEVMKLAAKDLRNSS